MTSVLIERRFCGPKTSGNGGYAAGLFAQMIDGPAEVTLVAPPPLDVQITLRTAREGFEAFASETLVARVKPGKVAIDPPALPDAAGIAAARDNFLDDANGAHLLPHCFVCGNKRAAGDGLRIFSGPAPDSPVNADFWTPHENLAGDDGLVRPEFLWAALDCPGAFALRNGLNLCLLGRFCVDIERRPKPGEKLVAAAWRSGRDGRKHFSDSALYDEDRHIIASANAVWIEINDPAFLERLKRENA
jgi:hypothetical protein